MSDVRGQGSGKGRGNERITEGGGKGLIDLEYLLKGFDNLFHSVWRHSAGQLGFLCLWIVKSFRIQGADLEAEKYCIFGKARLH